MTRLAPGTAIGDDFVIERALSEGGMGAVYVAMQRSTGVSRAVKTMHGELLGDERLRARFVEEARLAATIPSDHVVKVLGAGWDSHLGLPWLAMELLPGKPLTTVLEQIAPFSPALTEKVLEQACHGLGAAAALGITHRDVKPDNLFVSPSNTVGLPFVLKVLDFGIAKQTLGTGPKSTQVVGTPFWLAPEQTDTRPRISPATDVWPIGLIAFACLTGKNFWHTAYEPEASMQAFLRELVIDEIPAASVRAAERGAAVPGWFDGWFARCVARDPAARFADAREAFAAFASAREASGDHAAVAPSETARFLAALAGAPVPAAVPVTATAYAPPAMLRIELGPVVATEIPRSRVLSPDPPRRDERVRRDIPAPRRLSEPPRRSREVRMLGVPVAFAALFGIAYLGTRRAQDRVAECAPGTRRLAGACVGASRVTQLAAGGDHTCARFDNGAVKCWGENGAGQLGLGDTNDRGDAPGEMGKALKAVDLGAGRRATSVTAGALHTCVTLDDGAVKCWGDNRNERLGLGDSRSRGGRTGEMGDALPAVALGANRRARSIAAGEEHTCALLDDGAVKCWGNNDAGQVGLGVLERRKGGVSDAILSRKSLLVAAGGRHTCALLDDQTVKCWGDDSFGQLGIGDGKRGYGWDAVADKLPPLDLGQRTARVVTAGTEHTCAILGNGAVKCWGMNYLGALGLGDTRDRGKELRDMGLALPAVNLGKGRTAIAVTAAHTRTCAILDNRTLKCWGENRAGGLGVGDKEDRGDSQDEMGDSLPAINLGTGRAPVAIAMGKFHTCVLLDDGGVKCWGQNAHGALGLGDVKSRGGAPGEMGNALPTVDLGE